MFWHPILVWEYMVPQKFDLLSNRNFFVTFMLFLSLDSKELHYFSIYGEEFFFTALRLTFDFKDRYGFRLFTCIKSIIYQAQIHQKILFSKNYWLNFLLAWIMLFLILYPRLDIFNIFDIFNTVFGWNKHFRN